MPTYYLFYYIFAIYLGSVLAIETQQGCWHVMRLVLQGGGSPLADIVLFGQLSSVGVGRPLQPDSRRHTALE